MIEGDCFDVRDISDPEWIIEDWNLEQIGAETSYIRQSIYSTDHSGGQLIQVNFNSKKSQGNGQILHFYFPVE